jgi:TRAP-type C4-dicarboxylate transport system permease small subunit
LIGEGTERVGRHGPSDGALRVFDLILNAGAVLAAVLLIGVMLATTVKVIFRYGLREGLLGVDQISGTMLLYITFLGAAWVLRREEHVTIDLLVSALRPRIQRHLHVISSILGAFICLCLALFGTLEVITSLQKGIRIPAEIEMPRAVNLAVIPLGSLCLGLQFVRRAWQSFRGAGPAQATAARQD